jgi:hypothetical protein
MGNYGNYAEPQQPEVIDISRDTRSWSEVCPDEYFSLEYVGTRQINLHIIAVRQEKIGDRLKAVLRFSNDPRGLVLNKTNRDTLAKLFGDTPSAVVGQWITIGLGFKNRNPALLIAEQVPAVGNGQPAVPVPSSGPAPAIAAAPSQAATMSPELAAQFAQFLQQQPRA